jgi:two-component system sensor histidine kinase ResE
MFALFRTVSRERELAERKGNLVAAVSHEMRTPVASIRLLAENLSTGAADTKERRTNHLEQLLEQSERLSTLVENVLSYSKRGAGHAKWKMEPLNLTELLNHSATQFQALADSNGVTLKWEADTFATPPKGDSTALEQALVNLIDNALKHSPKGSELKITAQADSDRLTGWCLSVSDTGPGVSKGEREKVFEAFYRIGPELRRETKGTGLGLALVQQIAEAHSGEALCRESDSGGARFEVHLPYSPPTPNK